MPHDLLERVCAVALSSVFLLFSLNLQLVVFLEMFTGYTLKGVLKYWIDW